MRTAGRSALAFACAAAGAGVAIARAMRTNSTYDFAEKTVLITGGSRGLGLVLARQLVAQQAHVCLVARDRDELERAADSLHSAFPGAELLTVPADVREASDVEHAVARTIERFGRVDVLINCAGIIQVGPLAHMRMSDYEDAMNTHFWGPLRMVHAVLPHMRRQGGGRIVNISSIGGKLAVPHLLPYSASKFALTGLSDGLRTELAPDNIVVTTVCPGLMRTGSAVNAMFKGNRRHEYAWFAIAASLPVTSIGAERAAQQIIEACRCGRAELVITVQARLAAAARALTPQLVAWAMTVVNRLLPAPAAHGLGDIAEPGKANQSAWAPSVLTSLTYRAAHANNEL